jgi:hypothetical protein
MVLESQREKRGEKNRRSTQNSASIESLQVNGAFKVTAAKGLQAKTSKMGSHTGMSSRRFSGAHILGVGDRKSSNFIGMNSSRVVATGSWSGPSVNFLVSPDHVHRVSSFDRFDITPTNLDLMERIGNQNSFIEEGDFGANKKEMGAKADQSAPDESVERVLESSLEERCSGDTNAENVDAASVGVIAPRPEDLGVTHPVSFSWKTEGSLR